jgi:hypothetical protein
VHSESPVVYIFNTITGALAPRLLCNDLFYLPEMDPVVIYNDAHQILEGGGAKDGMPDGALPILHRELLQCGYQ